MFIKQLQIILSRLLVPLNHWREISSTKQLKWRNMLADDEIILKGRRRCHLAFHIAANEFGQSTTEQRPHSKPPREHVKKTIFHHFKGCSSQPAHQCVRKSIFIATVAKGWAVHHSMSGIWNIWLSPENVRVKMKAFLHGIMCTIVLLFKSLARGLLLEKPRGSECCVHLFIWNTHPETHTLCSVLHWQAVIPPLAYERRQLEGVAVTVVVPCCSLCYPFGGQLLCSRWPSGLFHSPPSFCVSPSVCRPPPPHSLHVEYPQKKGTKQALTYVDSMENLK